MVFLTISTKEDKYDFFSCVFLVLHLIETSEVACLELLLNNVVVSWSKKKQTLLLNFTKDAEKHVDALLGELINLTGEHSVPVSVKKSTSETGQFDQECALKDFQNCSALEEERRKCNALNAEREYQDTHQKLPTDLLPFFVSSDVSTAPHTVIFPRGSTREKLAFVPFLRVDATDPQKHLFTTDVCTRRTVNDKHGKFHLLLQKIITLQTKKRKYVHVDIKGTNLNFALGSLQCSLFNGMNQTVTKSTSSGFEVGASATASATLPLVQVFAKYSVNEGTSVSTKGVHYTPGLNKPNQQSLTVKIEKLPAGVFSIPVWLLFECSLIKSTEPASVSIVLSSDKKEGERDLERSSAPIVLGVPDIHSSIILHCFLGHAKSGKTALLKEWLRRIGASPAILSTLHPHVTTLGHGVDCNGTHIGKGLVNMYNVTDCPVVKEKVIDELRQTRPNETFTVILLDTRGVFTGDPKQAREGMKALIEVSNRVKDIKQSCDGVHVYQGAAIIQSAKRFYIRRSGFFDLFKWVTYCVTSWEDVESYADRNIMNMIKWMHDQISEGMGVKPTVVLTMVDRLVFPSMPRDLMFAENGMARTWVAYNRLRHVLSDETGIDDNYICGVAKTCTYGDGKDLADKEIEWYKRDLLETKNMMEMCLDPEHTMHHPYSTGADTNKPDYTDQTLEVLINSLLSIVTNENPATPPCI